MDSPRRAATPQSRRTPASPGDATATPSRLSVVLHAPLSASDKASYFATPTDDRKQPDPNYLQRHQQQHHHQQQQEQPTPAPRGRGRPRGWRPGMSYAEMRGGQPPSQRARPPPGAMAMRGKRGGGSRRGRKVAGPEASAREVYLQLRAAALVVFACEWAGCRAELHNLETLRRHVALVHVAAAADGRCRWGKKCQAAAAAAGEDSVSEGDGLARHVEERHMVPYAWYVGDGPRNDSIRGSLDAREDYLMDKEGNQVTPSVKDQEVEDHATWRENRRKLRELLIERDRNLPSESEEEEDD